MFLASPPLLPSQPPFLQTCSSHLGLTHLALSHLSLLRPLQWSGTHLGACMGEGGRRPWRLSPQSICPSIHPSIHSCIHPFIYLSVRLFIHSPVHPSIHLFIHLSIHPSPPGH